jgi:hypothetical protein
LRSSDRRRHRDLRDPNGLHESASLASTLLKRWDDIFGGDVFLAEPSPAVLQQETLPAQ